MPTWAAILLFISQAGVQALVIMLRALQFPPFQQPGGDKLLFSFLANLASSLFGWGAFAALANREQVEALLELLQFRMTWFQTFLVVLQPPLLLLSSTLRPLCAKETEWDGMKRRLRRQRLIRQMSPARRRSEEVHVNSEDGSRNDSGSGPRTIREGKIAHNLESLQDNDSSNKEDVRRSDALRGDDNPCNADTDSPNGSCLRPGCNAFRNLLGKLKMLSIRVASVVTSWLTAVWNSLTISELYVDVVAPLFEEFNYRALIEALLLPEGVPTTQRAVVSNVFFGLAHVLTFRDSFRASKTLAGKLQTMLLATQTIVVQTLAFGLISSYLLWLAGSVWPCVLLHSLCNIIGPPQMLTAQDWVLNVAGLCLFVLVNVGLYLTYDRDIVGS